jgi:RNA polymerase sigma factor (sigma-70 family)
MSMTSREMAGLVPYLRRIVLKQDSEGVSDAELLERFVTRRDEAAFELLLWRHGKMVLGVCQRVLRDRHEAEDAFQASFLVLARRAGSIGQREAIGSWLYRVAYRAALDAKARRARRVLRGAATEDLSCVASPTDPASAAAWQEIRGLIDDAVNRLPEKYRAAFVLCHLEGRSNAEAAHQLRCPVGTIESRLARARERLRAFLSRRGVKLSAGLFTAVVCRNVAPAGVSIPLAVSTVKAASIATGQAAGVITPNVAAVTEGVLRTMLVNKLQMGAAFLLAISLFFAGGGVATYHVLAAVQTAAKSADDDEKVGEVRRFEGHTDGAHWVVFSPDGKRALSCAAQPGMDDHIVRLWDVATGKELKKFEGHTERVEGVSFSPDGTRAASCGADKTIRLWDVEKGREIKKFEGHKDNVYSVVFSPDGKRLLSGSKDNTMRLWDVEKGEEIRKFEARADPVPARLFKLFPFLGRGSVPKPPPQKLPGRRDIRSVTFSPDGKHALSAGWDRAVRLWDLETGEEIKRFDGHTERVYTVAFSPDGKRAVSCSEDETIRLWDVEKGEEIKKLEGHTGQVFVATFSPDGKRVISGGEDKTVRLWDVENGKELHCFTGHEEKVRGVVFSPDGRYALSASVDKTLRLWRLPK